MTLLVRARTIVIVTLLMAVLSPAAYEPSTIRLRSRLDTIMRRHFRAGDFNGNVLVARGEKIVYERSFGPANREWSVPNDTHTRFEIGSMSKQFTALLVLQFVNEGKIRLDGRVTDYLPYYRHDTGERISIHHLLTGTNCSAGQQR
jgi:CubicO group peptidase (beta-lactamase class C family)